MTAAANTPFCTQPRTDWYPYGHPSRMKATLWVLAVQLFPACSAGDGASLLTMRSAGTGGAQYSGSGGIPNYTPPPVESGGGAGVPLQPASGGSPSVVPRDPTAFAWPEAAADGGGAHLCEPGHYVGTYECFIVPPPAPGAGGTPTTGGFLLTGPVDLTLASQANGEFLEVTGGSLKANAGLLLLDAPLEGKLSCATGIFEGDIQNGSVSIPPFPPGGTATGPLKATFESGGPKLTGTWQLVGGPEFGGWGCSGTWSASWQGP